MKKILSALLLSIILFSCAEVVPPSGGEKDTTPPKAKKSTPENYSTNFTSKKIEIKFDEFIKLNSGGGNIIISPSLNKKPKIELIGKKVTISFQEELLKETTYIINFGSSISDNNEGNVLKDYKYIFSTGTFIDSLKIEGKIINAFNKKNVKDVMIALYPEGEDSVLYKKPLYFTKTNENGFYSLENLKSNNYKIAALEDKNLNYIFDQENEMIGFSEELIILKENIKDKDLIIFQNIEKIRVKENTNKEANHIIFTFNKPFLDLELNIDNYSENEIIYYSLDKKQLNYWYLNRDSINTNFSIKTNNDVIDSFNLKLKIDTNTIPFSFELNNQKTEKNNVLILDFPFPISNFNQDSLIISHKNKTIPYKVEWLNNNLRLEIKTNTLYDTLIINSKENSFTSFHNLKSIELNDTLTAFNKQLSSLIINLNKADNLIIELYDKEDNLIDAQIVSRETTINFNNLNQGQYFIRIFRDNNKDGIWNSGLFHVKQQPEKTLIYQSVELKDNWDKEIDILIQ